MDEAIVAQLQGIIQPILADQGMELVELTCRPQGRQQLVRVLVDQVGGVTIQRCATANQLIGQALEAANLMEGSYTIEVSSPGLDRPLTSRRDFERAVGEAVWVERAEADGRLVRVEGMVLAVQAEAVVLKTSAGNLTVPLADIRLAKKALQW